MFLRFCKSIPPNGRVFFVYVLVLVVYLWFSMKPQFIVASSSSSNYLSRTREGKTVLTGNYIVNSPKCRMPEIDLWNEESNKSYAMAKPWKCLTTVPGSIPGLTYVEKTMLVLNVTILKSMNLSMDTVDCRYRVIQNSKTKISSAADRPEILSTISFPITREKTVPVSNMIEVGCLKTARNGSKLELHRDYHLLANLYPQTDETRQRTITKKIQFWRNNATARPPNLYILGIDGATRLNVRRQMPLTVKFLEDLGAVELQGYNKVGPHSANNFVPVMTSYHVHELDNICKFLDNVVQDSCPWIFTNFSTHNYITSFIEDDNSFRTGFRQPPTDFYPMPWMRHVRNTFKRLYNICVEKKTKPQVMIQFMQDLAESLHLQHLPHYSQSWITHLAHNRFNALQGADEFLRNSLSYLNRSGYWDNSFLILMGDHGMRWSFPSTKIRLSVTGWYEDKLPVLWIKLPKRLAKQHPDWEEALAYNRNKLSSAFDLHETLKQILSLSGPVPPRHSPRGHSLFQKLPDRSCAEAGVREGYCTCTVLVPFRDVHQKFLKEAIDSIVESRTGNFTNFPRNKKCIKMHVGKILAAAVMTNDGYPTSDWSDDYLKSLIFSGTRFVLTIETDPDSGRVQIEYILRFDVSSKTFTADYLFGVNAKVVQPMADRGYFNCVPL